MNYKDTPLWDESLDIEARLDYLVGELTTEEKLGMLGIASPEIERLGITAQMSLGGEAAHGVEARHDQSANNNRQPEETTAFTQPIGLSATFDTELMEKVGSAVGYEARALYNSGDTGLSRWAPTVDMERDPRWGRNEEGYGEDPYLTGKMASAYVRGMKGEHPFYILTAATLKHFYANNVENGREYKSSSVDPRNKLEYYIEPFRRCIVEGGAQGVMTAYNEINGIPCNLNDEVNTYLRDEYGFEGHVVTDQGDLSQTVDSHHYTESFKEALVMTLNAGVDVMTDDPELIKKAATEAYESGMLTDTMLNRAIRHSYATRIRLGMFDPYGTTPYAGVKKDVINCKKHRELAREAAQKACILLKNEDGFFPMKHKESNVVLIGPWTDAWYNDWYGAKPPYKVTIYDALAERYGSENIKSDDGLDRIIIGCKGGYIRLNEKNEAVVTGNADEAEVFSVNDWGNGHAHLRASNGLLLRTNDEGRLIAQNKEAFEWFIREDLDLRKRNDGRYEINNWNGLKIGTFEDGIKACGVPEFIFKDRVPMMGDWESDDDTFIFEIKVKSSAATRCRELAATADRVILCLGCNPCVNSKEAVDRENLNFIESQSALVKAVAGANENTGIVLVANYPYYLEEELSLVKAVLLTASGSEELGHGVSDCISGKVSPAGRLNETWYGKDGVLPDFNNYDIRKTGRTYRYYTHKPLFAFGYGKSYTEFTYKNLRFNPDGKEPAFDVDVTNVGNYPSDEVIQLYVSASDLRVEQPQKKLVGFRRVHFAPGEKKRIHFTVPKKELAYYDVVREEMIVETGIYEFFAGGSSDDLQTSVICAINGVEPGERVAYIPITAHRYDEYENCYLYNTPDRVKHLRSCDGRRYVAEYRDITYEVAPGAVTIQYVTLPVHCEGDARDMRIRLYFGDELLIDSQVVRKEENEVCTFTLPIDNLGMIGMENINHTVRLKCGAGVGLVSFVFEP